MKSYSPQERNQPGSKGFLRKLLAYAYLFKMRLFHPKEAHMQQEAICGLLIEIAESMPKN